MNDPLFRAGLLLLLVLTCCLWCARAHLIPKRITPFAQLDAQTRQTVLRRKFRFRAAAVFLFTLAGLSLFSPLPKGVTLSALLGGFYCQYRVFRLRRRYPVIFTAGVLPE